MEEKVFLNESEKIELLEKNNILMARQMELVSLRDRFIDLNNNTIPRLQKELDMFVSTVLNKYNGTSIESDYSIVKKSD